MLGMAVAEGLLRMAASRATPQEVLGSRRTMDFRRTLQGRETQVKDWDTDEAKVLCPELGEWK